MNAPERPEAFNKSKRERELLQKMKKMLDEMKIRATPDRVVEFLVLFEEFYTLKGVPKAQIAIKKAKKRQSDTKSTEK